MVMRGTRSEGEILSGDSGVVEGVVVVPAHGIVLAGGGGTEVGGGERVTGILGAQPDSAKTITTTAIK